MQTDELNPFDIDQNQLDREWVEHIRKFHKYAKKLVKARDEYERSKVNQDLVYAELDQEVRKHPEKYGLDKVTEGAIGKTIETNQRYREAIEKTLDTKHRVNILQIAVDTLEHRKKALENLVQLWLASYFAQPQLNGEQGKRMKEVQSMKAFKKKDGA